MGLPGAGLPVGASPLGDCPRRTRPGGGLTLAGRATERAALSGFRSGALSGRGVSSGPSDAVGGHTTYGRREPVSKCVISAV